ncbi:MAG TPA: FAD-linked oxidase C-terminal domain-containing protein [Pyrinomonadaceae bacterium]
MDTLIQNLIAIVGEENVLSEPDELLVYECDGLPHHKHRPRAVVFPSSTEETSSVMRELANSGVPFTPRGAGTGLSGGALALNEGVVVEMARMRKILKIDVENRLAIVQPGVVNLQVSLAAAPFGLYYVPDPSSQPTCTIGGNIAESAGGIHCLKYGTTTDHVLGCRVVLAGGEIVDLGSATGDARGYDLLGTFIGSEGTFGIATEATLRLVEIPPGVRTLLAEFTEVDDASHAVSAIIAAGVMPAALEMMDREIIRAVEASIFAAGLPPDAGAALLIEIDGIEMGIDDEAARVTSICLEFGARSCRLAHDDAERKKLWAARKGAFGAIGRISPDSMIQDAVVPRSRLPEVLAAAYGIATKYQLRIANVFHAGDGNLHPLICFDSRSADQVQRVKEAGRELMQICVAAGGTITGEHGVGLDKRELLPLVFSDSDMNAMLSVRAAFDPIGLCNPGKIVPMLRGCGEGRAVTTETLDSSSNGYSATNVQSRPTGNDAPKRSLLFDPASAMSQLQKILGDKNCSIGEEKIVASPASTEEMSEIMKLAGREGWTVLPAGASTWVDAIHPSGANIIVNTTRMNRVIEHEPADLITVTEAGVPLSELNRQLSENGQWLPLDPPDDGRATIGGVVATGLSGTQQIGYGRPRGSVIGMKVVLSDGRTIKTGGRVVKNVAGYDLSKLFTGSYGTLGVITELNFKLRPRPELEATVVAIGNQDGLISAGQSILKAKLFPVALELVSSAITPKLNLQSSSGPQLLVRFAGTEKGVKYQLNEALKHFNQEGLVSNAQIITEDHAVWRSVAAMPLQLNATFGWRTTVLPGRLAGFLHKVREIYCEPFDSLCWHAGVGCGRVRVIDSTTRSEEDSIKLFEALQRATVTSGGSFFIEHSEGGLHSSLVRPPEGIADLTRRVKEQLDPSSIFPKLNFA